MEFWARRQPWIVALGMIAFAVLTFVLANGLWFLLNRFGSPGLILCQAAALVVATAVATRFIDRAGLATVGLGWGGFAGREMRNGAALGVALAALCIVVIGVLSDRVAIEVRGISSMTWVWTVLLVLLHAAGEELLYRGYLFQRLDELAGSVVATVASVGLFTFAHAGNPAVTPVGLLTIALGGLLFSLIVLRTSSLWSAILCHALWNLVIGLGLGLPVSGHLFDGGGLVQMEIEGRELLTGGGFGPEGSIVAAIVVAAGCAGVLLLRQFDTRPERFASRFRQLYNRAVLVAGETRRGHLRRSPHSSGMARSAGGSSPSIND